MANRMDIELTSAREDEFTWRAAGARQPRGAVSSALLPPASKVGDVLRAEVEVEIDGITIVSILPPKEKASPNDRIEYIGPARPNPGVTTVLASRGERRGQGERGRETRRHEGGRERRREGAPGERGRGPRRDERSRGTERRGEEERSRPGTLRERAEAERGRPGPVRERPEGERGRRPGQRETQARRGPARFEPGTAHRDELFAAMSPEQRPIAERLAAGGLPAVRKALAEEQQRARAEGRPAVSGDPIVAIAEQLLPDVKAAVWLDRAEAAVGRLDEISLRDLRTTVVGASPRDETGRALERQLREALERRVSKLRQDWESHLAQAIGDGRVLQALRLSAKPPEPTARFPGALAARLAELAGQAMTEETSPERWLALLQAAVESPVRRQVRPLGLPKDESGELERQARMAASRVPALARLLGMPIPPPPRPGPGERRPPLQRQTRSRPPVRRDAESSANKRPGALAEPGAGKGEAATPPGEAAPVVSEPSEELAPASGALAEAAEEVSETPSPEEPGGSVAAQEEGVPASAGDVVGAAGLPEEAAESSARTEASLESVPEQNESALVDPVAEESPRTPPPELGQGVVEEAAGGSVAAAQEGPEETSGDVVGAEELGEPIDEGQPL